MAQSPQSRADIQVVRAVAVLAVVAFHLDADTLPGGFLGVDVFFAISGYLISGQIISRIEAGEWSFAEFYRRRIRRLFPALFCTIVVSALFAYGLLWPDQTMDFLKSAVFAIFGASNFYFLATRDYFSPAAGLVPLLHTWSLGIEEQFYLLWPLGIFAILSTRGLPALAPIAVLLLLASLLAAAAAISRHPDEVFYLLPFRAFEFLAGALAFLWQRPIASRNVKALAAAGAWLAVAVSFFTTTSASPIAGMIAATAGTSLLLALDACPSGGPARLLVPFRYVGDISYSLYLVHWPVVVFWRLHTGEAPGYFEMAALFVACLTLAALQYHLVEDPIRRAKTFPLGISRNIVRSFAASGLVVIALFASGALTSGWTFRLDETQLGYLTRPSQEEVEWQYDLPACFRSGDYASVARFAEAGCIRAGAGKTNLLLLGDSTAAQFSGSLRERRDWTVSQITASACTPAIGWNDRRDAACGKLVREALAFIETSPLIDAVILSGAYYNHPTLRASLEKTVERIVASGKRAVVLGPVVRYDAPLPYLLAQFSNEADPDARIASHLLASEFDHDLLMREVVEKAGGTYVSIVEALCDRGTRRCATLVDGAPIQRDAAHLSIEGARLVAPHIVEAVAPRQPGPTTTSQRTAG